MQNRTENFGVQRTADHQVLWPFWLELALTAVIPFIIWWSNTPTNVLNSSGLWKLLESAGIGGSGIVFFAGIPVGIIGIKAAKKMEKLRTATKMLSIINLCAGILEFSMLILLLCAVIFGGVSV